MLINYLNHLPRWQDHFAFYSNDESDFLLLHVLINFGISIVLLDFDSSNKHVRLTKKRKKKDKGKILKATRKNNK